MNIIRPYYIEDQHGNAHRRYGKWKQNPGVAVIRCNECDKPATEIDHYHPYCTDFTLCRLHALRKRSAISE